MAKYMTSPEEIRGQMTVDGNQKFSWEYIKMDKV